MAHPTEQLFNAVAEGDAAAVCAALAAGADINYRAYSFDGMAPLHLAVCFEQADCVAALLDGGADVNIRDTGGATPLHWACGH